MFDNLSLRAKLVASFSVMAVLLALVGGASYFSLRQVVEKYDHVASINLPNSDALGEMESGQMKLAVGVMDLVGTHANPAKIEKSEAEFHAQIKKNLEIVAFYESVPFVNGESELWDPTKAQIERSHEIGSRLMALSKSGSKADEELRDQLAATDYAEARTHFQQAIGKLKAFQMAEAKSWSADAQTTGNRVADGVVILVTGGFVLSLAIGFFLARSLSKSLREFSLQIGEAAQKTAHTSTQLLNASSQLSSGSTEAASSLEETLASLVEISSMVQLNAKNAKEANEQSHATCEAAEQGEKQIQHLIEAMAEMATSSKKIEEIITTIDDIAFQTNLLALNAAMEAARAGEHGRGFAVVAEAVGGLARRSANSAKDINILIKESVERAENGSKIADSSGVVLKNIVNGVKKVAALNNDISSASHEQSIGVSQINESMNHLDQTTKVNASCSEDVATSAEDMSSQSANLQVLVSELMAVVDGAKKKVGAEASVTLLRPPSTNTYRSELSKNKIAS